MGRYDSSVISYSYREDIRAVIGVLHVERLDVENVSYVTEYATRALDGLPSFENFIIDARSLRYLTAPSIGILMRAIRRAKQENAVLSLILDESVYREIRLHYPGVIGHFGIYNAMDEAIRAVEKAREEK